MGLIEKWVRYYYSLGFSVFPVKQTDPPSVDNKRPNISTWKKYIDKRPTQEEIEQWLKEKKFQNIALVLGHVSGDIVALDLDDDKIVDDAELTLDTFMNDMGIWVQATGKDGRYHLIGKHTGDPGNTQKDNNVNLEYRANGAYIVICPSVHPNGKVYHYLNYEKVGELPELKTHDMFRYYNDIRKRLYEKRHIQKKVTEEHIEIEGIEAPCIANVFKGGLKEGRRNDTALALASWYKNTKKLNPTEIKSLMINWNKRNDPALPLNELTSVVNSALQKNRKTGCPQLRQLGFCPFASEGECEFINATKIDAIIASAYIDEEKNILYEEVQDIVTGISRFVSYQEGNILYQAEIVNGSDSKIMPVNDTKALKYGAMYLPSRPEEYGDLQTLIDALNDFIQKYMDVSDLFRMISVWYIILSWSYDKLNTIPYLRVLADFGTGKSRFLDVVGKLCYKPMNVAGSLTTATLFRTIDIWNGTLILDEFSLKESDETQDIIRILNCGFEIDKPVSRCVPNINQGKKDELGRQDKRDYLIEYFKTFGPKVISSRRGFQDQALNSRCLTEILHETSRTDIPIILPPQFKKEQEILRNKLLMYRLLHWNQIDPNDILKLKFPDNIQKRLKQAFSNFAVLFSHNAEYMKLFMSYVQKYNDELTEERAGTYDGRIVNTFFELKKEGFEFVTSKMIAEQMTEKSGGDKKLSPATVGRHLKILGLPTVSKTHHGPDGYKTYRVVDETLTDVLKALKTRYVITELKDEEESSLPNLDSFSI